MTEALLKIGAKIIRMITTSKKGFLKGFLLHLYLDPNPVLILQKDDVLYQLAHLFIQVWNLMHRFDLSLMEDKIQLIFLILVMEINNQKTL